MLNLLWRQVSNISITISFLGSQHKYSKNSFEDDDFSAFDNHLLKLNFWILTPVADRGWSTNVSQFCSRNVFYSIVHNQSKLLQPLSNNQCLFFSKFLSYHCLIWEHKKMSFHNSLPTFRQKPSKVTLFWSTEIFDIKTYISLHQIVIRMILTDDKACSCNEKVWIIRRKR